MLYSFKQDGEYEDSHVYNFLSVWVKYIKTYYLYLRSKQKSFLVYKSNFYAMCMLL